MSGCTCGYGGFHEELNPRCDLNLPAEETRVPCFVCGKGLDEAAGEDVNQPSNGLAFVSSGHYGSTAFDPMDGTWLELNICDDCLTEREDRVLRGKQPRVPRPKPIYTPWKEWDESSHY